MDCSLPGSSVNGILQARILEWVAIPFSRGSSRPRDQTWVSRTADRLFAIWATREAPNKGLGSFKGNYKGTAKHPRASNHRKLSPSLGLKGKERKQQWGLRRSCGCREEAVAFRRGEQPKATMRPSREGKLISFSSPSIWFLVGAFWRLNPIRGHCEGYLVDVVHRKAELPTAERWRGK